MLISVHLPKTAGSSLFHILENHFGAGFQPDYHDTPPRRRLRLAKVCTLLAPSIKCIHGHFPASRYARGTKIIFVRDPYRRAISEYHYGQRQKAAGVEHFQTRTQFDLSLPEYLKREEYAYTHLIDISPQQFQFIGSADHFEQDLSRLCRDILGKQHPMLNENRNPNGGNYEDAGLRSIFETANPQSVEIYQAMMAERAKQI